MKFTTILFNLAVVATTTTNGVHGMSDDMDNTTDTTAVAASSDGEEEGGGGFFDNMKKAWGDLKNGLECEDEVVTVYTENPDLMAAYDAWDKSGTKTIVGNEETSTSFTWAYDMDLCKAFMKECEKVEGMIFTPIDDETYECEYYGIGNGDGKPTVATSGNGVCLKDSDSCNSFGPEDAANGEMYIDLENIGGFVCKSLVSDDSGASTTFLGSVVVAATSVVAVTVLLI